MPLRTKDIGCILGIQAPWEVSEVTLAHEAREVQIHVTCRDGYALSCPACGSVCPGYDHRRRQWRHLDMCDYRTMVVADLPRVECPEHGVRTVTVPWADPKARFRSGLSR